MLIFECGEYSDTQVSPAINIVLRIRKCDQHFSRKDNTLQNQQLSEFLENAAHSSVILDEYIYMLVVLAHDDSAL